ncbi:MAG: M48 family metallopeptidase [Pseudomonadota bacterium]
MPSAFEILIVLALIVGAIAMSDLREALGLEGLKEKSDRVGRKGFRPLQLLGDDEPRAARAWIVPDEAPNAFVAQGSEIFLTSGLIDLYKQGVLTPEEVTAILAHEIAHIELGHYAQMKRRSDAAAVGGVVVSRMGGLASWVLGEGLKLERLSMGRQAEFEADARAVEILRRRRLDPDALATALEKFGAQNAVQNGPSWLDTHPPIPERVSRIRSSV